MKLLPKIGATATSKKTYTTADVEDFAKLSGDINPIHLDPAYAATTKFQQPVVHGLFVAAQISCIIANQLPGPGSVYLNQALSFKLPVFHNDEISCTVIVTSVREDKQLIELTTTCTNQNGGVVIEGTALVKLM